MLADSCRQIDAAAHGHIDIIDAVRILQRDPLAQSVVGPFDIVTIRCVYFQGNPVALMSDVISLEFGRSAGGQGRIGIGFNLDDVLDTLLNLLCLFR